MNKTKCLATGKIGFVLCTALLGALTGCVGHVDGPHHARVYAPPPPVYVESGVVVQDDYVYYPGYQVYYSSNRANTSIRTAVHGYRDQRRRASRLTCCLPRRR